MLPTADLPCMGHSDTSCSPLPTPNLPGLRAGQTLPRPPAGAGDGGSFKLVCVTFFHSQASSQQESCGVTGGPTHPYEVVTGMSQWLSCR